MTAEPEQPGVDLVKRGGQVRHRPAAEPERVEVLDSELVDDAAPVRPRKRVQLDVISKRVPDLPAVRRGSWSAGRATIRHGYVAGRGVVSWAARAGSASTHGHLREQVRLARAAGDKVALKEWIEQLESARDGRLQRMLALPKLIVSLLIAAAMAIGVALAVLLVLGLAVQLVPGGAGWGDFWSGVGDVVALGSALVKWSAAVAAAGGLPVVAVLAWREGRRVAEPPTWLLAPTQRAQAGAEITSDAITKAMAHMGIAALTRALKAGEVLVFVVPPREQGGGTYFQVRVPLGVKAADFLPSDRVELFAGNLARHKHETWPQRQPDADARVLDCWIADKGTLDKPAPPWPLLTEGVIDIFRDQLPWGVTMRGEQVTVGVLQKHWLVGATSKQGKTWTVRVLVLGLALDVTVELRIADLKGDGDWSMFADIATTLIEGSADEDAEATCVMLEDLVEEMQRRYDKKRELGIVGSIPRELSRRKGSGFHPIFAIVDECQVLYAAPHPVGGAKDDARAWRAAKRLHDQARAVNIHLWQATQRPDNRTLPVMVREGAHVRAALNVPNETTAKMVLADAADRGARPQDLRPGRDAGTVVATGELEAIPAGLAFIIIRTHAVDGPSAWAVAKRAVELRANRGRHLAAVPAVAEEPEVDHLADVETAMRAEAKVRTTVVLARLIEDDPDRYEGWDHVRLSELLREAGCPPVKDSVMVVRLADVQRAIDEREARRG